MGHRADQFAGDVARELRVGVESDDVANCFESGDVADDGAEPVAWAVGGVVAVGMAGLRPLAEQRIELRQLPALAFVPHPYLFLRIPAPWPMQEIEDVATIPGVFAVEQNDAFGCQLNQLFVVWQGFLRSVLEIGEKREANMGIAVGQITDFQPFQKSLDAGECEHGWNDDDRAALGKNPFGIIHARERMRVDGKHRQPIDHADAEMHRGGDGDQSNHRQADDTQATVIAPDQEAGDCRECDDEHGSEIDRKGKSATELPGDQRGGETHLCYAFQRGLALVDEVVTDMSGGVARLIGRDHLAELDRLAGHFELRQLAALGDTLNGVAIAIARGKIHRGIDSCRFAAQDLFDDAHLLDEITPIHRAEKSQTGNAVADRNLVRGLVLVLCLNQLLNGEPLILQAMFHPTGGKAEIGALTVQMPGEFGDKCAAERDVGAGHVGQHEDQIGRVFLDDLHHPIGPLVGDIAVLAAGCDARGNAAQILDQRQTQHDRHAPQLAERERLNRLVRCDEPAETRGVEPAIDVGDQLQRDAVGTRVAGGRAVRQCRQLPAV